MINSEGLNIRVFAKIIKAGKNVGTHDANSIAARGFELNGWSWKRQLGATFSKEQRLALLRHTWMHNGCVSVFLDQCRKGLPRFAPRCAQNLVAGPRPILESIGVLGKLQGVFVQSEVDERKAQA